MLKHAATPGTVTFSLAVTDVDQAVSVVGEFNDWNPYAHPLKKRSNGTRRVKVELTPGRAYRFKYLAADGNWMTDPDAATADNGMAGVDSLVVV